MPHTRRHFLRFGTALLATAAGGPLASAAQGRPKPFDLSFYHFGDPHYLAFDQSTKAGVALNPVIRENIRHMAALAPGLQLPDGLGKIGRPVGAIDVGDCIEAGNEPDPDTGQPIGGAATRVRQWENYVADLGLTGSEPGTLVDFPIYEGYGNHDQDSFVQGIIDRISARNASRPGIVALSSQFDYPDGGPYRGVSAKHLHYAWRWGPVHFIQANIRVGDSTARYPAAGSFSFVKDYLENAVASSGAPVIIAVHLPPDTAPEGDWPAADRLQFYDLIRGFNVIAILCGHAHSFNISNWRGPDKDGPSEIPVLRCDTIHRSTPDGGFMNVFRLASSPRDPGIATLALARRMRDGTWGDSHSIQFAAI
jgi:cytolysin (calcineurin-like family phosphatase)